MLCHPPVLAKIQSAGLLGVEAYQVWTEVEVGPGLPGYHLVGLAAGAVREGGVRVRAAIVHSGFKLPPRKITVNLAPADVRKDGAAFDLPIAIGVLAGLEIVPTPALAGVLLLGELSLDGSVRAITGSLPVAILARRLGVRALVLPAKCAAEAAGLTDLPVFAVESLAEVVGFLNGATTLRRAEEVDSTGDDTEDDLSEVAGQRAAKFALEIAAAGGHNLLLVGPPGTGKSMLARRVPTILPPLDEAEMLETSAIYSVAGKLQSGLCRRRPFRAPHHDISIPGLIGGGPFPQPGEISLAHHGVLFLDELPEFRGQALEALRQPLEERAITIARARAVVRFPASFCLVGAMNPCPCGYYGAPNRACTCDTGRVARYRRRISGPLLDRFDMHVYVPPVSLAQLTEEAHEESSTLVRQRTVAARTIQQKRLGPKRANAHMQGKEIRKWCAIDQTSTRHLERVAKQRGISARAIHRILRVARTVADLRGAEKLEAADLQLAVEFRCLDEALQ